MPEKVSEYRDEKLMNIDQKFECGGGGHKM